MQRILIKHLSGSKSGQTDLFELPFKEFTLGRNATCDIRYDPELDDVVSRTHAKIVQESGTPPVFTLVDINSRNGTFLNGVRIAGPTVINVDDRVRLGENGPDFVFEVDPRPKDAVKATRIAPLPDIKALKEQASQKESRPIPQTQQPLPAAGTGAQRKRAPVVAVLLAGLAVLLFYRSQQEPEQPREAAPPETAVPVAAVEETPVPTASAAQIARDYGEATVLVQARWKLVTEPEGRPLHQVVACTAFRGRQCANQRLPWYARAGSRIEPYLSAGQRGHRVALTDIGGESRGTGFVVGQEGLILTSRQLAAGWDTRYFAVEAPPLPGYLIPCDSRCDPRRAELWNPGDPRFAGMEKRIRQWVPSRTTLLNGKPVREKALAGRHEALEVAFPKTRTRIPAQLARVSARADVALVKIDLPQALKPVMLSTEVSVQAGEAVTLLGYPLTSPDTVAWQNAAGGNHNLTPLPDPTLSAGIVARVLGSPDPTLRGEPREAYQLDLGASGISNAGAPVFNDRGQVIGTFSAGPPEAASAQLKLAVPIQYGLELLDPAAGTH